MGLALFLASALAAAAPSAEDGPPIVVTARPLQDTEAALRACLARKCPTEEDIDASLAHAENLFVAGDYREARTVIRQSLGRNRRQARAFPVPVSDLFRANALVANHLGFEEDYVRSSWAILETLRKGLGDGDARLFGARMEVAAMLARTRGAQAAEEAYAALARDSVEAGRRDIAAIANVRAASLAYRQTPTRANRRRLADIAASTVREERAAALMAKLFLARVAREAGRQEEADALTREIASVGFKAPVLIYAPPYQLTVHETGGARAEDLNDPNLPGLGNPATRFGGNFDKLWVDVGFWVQPDGQVADLEVLRRSGSTDWAGPLLRSIAGRRYAPTAESAYRVERYSYTSSYEVQTGTHLRQRSPRARVEYLDLTVDENAGSR